MATFTLTYPKLLDRFSNIPILYEQNEAVCMLQKVERSSVGKIFNTTLLIATQVSVPQRYETRSTLDAPLFQLQSTLFTKGVSHQLLMSDGTTILIQRKTVQLLESTYSFTMDGLINYLNPTTPYSLHYYLLFTNHCLLLRTNPIFML